MAGDRRRLTLVGTGGPPSLSASAIAELDKLLETPLDFHTIGVKDPTTGEVRNEYHAREGLWRAPEQLTTQQRQAAELEFQRTIAALETPKPDVVVKWLTDLALLTRTRDAGEDSAIVRCEAYCKMLMARGFPVGLFTDATLHELVQRHRFFPSYAEISDVLEPRYTRLQERMVRLDTLTMFVPVQDPQEPPS